MSQANTPPTVVISASSQALTPGQSVKVTFTFNESIKFFGFSKLEVKGGTLSGWTQISPTQWVATFKPTNQNTALAVISVPAGVFKDMGGLANSAGNEYISSPLRLCVPKNLNATQVGKLSYAEVQDLSASHLSAKNKSGHMLLTDMTSFQLKWLSKDAVATLTSAQLKANDAWGHAVLLGLGKERIGWLSPTAVASLSGGQLQVRCDNGHYVLEDLSSEQIGGKIVGGKRTGGLSQAGVLTLNSDMLWLTDASGHFVLQALNAQQIGWLGSWAVNCLTVEQLWMKGASGHYVLEDLTPEQITASGFGVGLNPRTVHGLSIEQLSMKNAGGHYVLQDLSAAQIAGQGKDGGLNQQAVAGLTIEQLWTKDAGGVNYVLQDLRYTQIVWLSQSTIEHLSSAQLAMKVIEDNCTVLEHLSPQQIGWLDQSTVSDLTIEQLRLRLMSQNFKPVLTALTTEQVGWLNRDATSQLTASELKLKNASGHTVQEDLTDVQQGWLSYETLASMNTSQYQIRDEHHHVLLDNIASSLRLQSGDPVKLTFIVPKGFGVFTAQAIEVVGGDLSALTKDDFEHYSAIFTPQANFEGKAQVNLKSAVDASESQLLKSLILHVDTIAPEIVISSSRPGVGPHQSTTITFTLSEDRKGLNPDDIQVTGGALSDFKQVDRTHYTAVFTPDAHSRSPAVISVEAGRFTDMMGNENLASRPLTIAVDTLVPTVEIRSSRWLLNDEPVEGLDGGEDLAKLTFIVHNSNDRLTQSDITVSHGAHLRNWEHKSGTQEYTAELVLNGNVSGTTKVTVSVVGGALHDDRDFPSDPTMMTLSANTKEMYLENATILEGAAKGDLTGLSVKLTGDINGDGFGDAIISAPNAGLKNKEEAGVTYVYFGKGDSAAIDPLKIDLAALASGKSKDGFAILGEMAGDHSGQAVTAGDFNGDGLIDIGIGAPDASDGAGRIYVVLGKRSDTNAVELSAVALGAGGYVATGEAGSHSGSSLSAGDVNGDGRDDLLIGTFANTVEIASGTGGVRSLTSTIGTGDLGSNYLQSVCDQNDLNRPVYWADADAVLMGEFELLRTASRPQYLNEIARLTNLRNEPQNHLNLAMPILLDLEEQQRVFEIGARERAQARVQQVEEYWAYDNAHFAETYQVKLEEKKAALFWELLENNALTLNDQEARAEADRRATEYMESIAKLYWQEYEAEKERAAILERAPWDDELFELRVNTTMYNRQIERLGGLIAVQQNLLDELNTLNLTFRAPDSQQRLHEYELMVLELAQRRDERLSRLDSDLTRLTQEINKASTALSEYMQDNPGIAIPQESLQGRVLPSQMTPAQHVLQRLWELAHQVDTLRMQRQEISDAHFEMIPNMIPEVFSETNEILTQYGRSMSFLNTALQRVTNSNSLLSEVPVFYSPVPGTGMTVEIIDVSTIEELRMPIWSSDTVIRLNNGWMPIAEQGLWVRVVHNDNGTWAQGWLPVYRYTQEEDAGTWQVMYHQDGAVMELNHDVIVVGEGLSKEMVAEIPLSKKLQDQLNSARMLEGESSVEAGKGYVVFGKNDGEAVDLSALGKNGIVINGADTAAGRAVVGAGQDTNGDGYEDIIVGTPDSSPSGRIAAGSAYVIFGDRAPKEVELSNVAAGKGGFVINGADARDHLGTSVAGAGDVNGDGLADVIVGAPYASPGGKTHAGSAYVVFGKTSTGAVELSTVALGTGKEGFVIRGESAGDYAGSAISGAGDFNGDGFDDILVGAASANGGAGNTYLVYGKRDGGVIELSNVAHGSGGFVIHGEAGSGFSGLAVSGGGDLNGDGYADLLISSPLADLALSKANAGSSYIIYGNAANVSETVTLVQSTIQIDVLGGEPYGTATGTSKNETLMGSQFCDQLWGGGGRDMIYAGAGDDIAILDASNVANLNKVGQPVARIDLGEGMDTLLAAGKLNFTALGNTQIKGVESLVLSSGLTNSHGKSTVVLTAKEVLALDGQAESFTSWWGADQAFTGADQRQFVLTGYKGDVLVLSDLSDWNKVATSVETDRMFQFESNYVHTYTVYEHKTLDIQLLKDTDIALRAVL